MSRDILGTTTKPAAAGTETEIPSNQQQGVVPQTKQPDDALAGALPAWDLLPQNQFIRRVK